VTLTTLSIASEDGRDGNVATPIIEHARTAPEQLAVVVPDAGGITYRELDRRSAGFCAALEKSGFRCGDRIILAAPLSTNFYALALGVLRGGMTLVLIDGHIGLRRALKAVTVSDAAGIVSASQLLRWGRVVPALRRVKRISDKSLAALISEPAPTSAPAPLHADQPAMVAFTSGTGGTPKGGVRTHNLLAQQHRVLLRSFPLRPGDVDMPCFPAFVLHNLGCGATTVLPPGDVQRPSQIDPALVLRAIERYGVTSLSGAPAFIRRLTAATLTAGRALAGMRRVLVGGAPVPPRLCRDSVEAFPEASVRVVYGSTEAEPIAHIEASHVSASIDEGLLVGHPVPEIDLVVAALPEPRPALGPDGLTPYSATHGEVVVRGPHVARAYVGDPVASARLKLVMPTGDVWHCTGDTARLDARGRLWLTGREGDGVVHQGRVLHPLGLEAAVLDVPGVKAAALVAHARAPEGEVAVVLDGDVAHRRLRRWLSANGLGSLPVRRVAALPVDARHRSKVNRPALQVGLEGWRARLGPARWMQPK
jgi:olefin beta-lactone synthetase